MAVFFTGFSYFLNVSGQSDFWENIISVAKPVGYILVALIFIAGIISIARRLTSSRTNQTSVHTEKAASNIFNDTGEVTDKRIIAAITAAIAAYYPEKNPESGAGFIVRSIKKRI